MALPALRLAIFILLFTGCGKSGFKGKGDPQSADANPSPVPTEPASPTPTPIESPSLSPNPSPNVFHLNDVVLAVRQPSCISCHAKVKGDLVSDFMSGTDLNFASNNYQFNLATRFYGTTYRPETFANLNVDGQLLVAKFNLESPLVTNRIVATAPISLKTALVSVNKVPVFNGDPNVAIGETNVVPVAKIGKDRDKNLVGVNELIETDITINPPKAVIIEAAYNSQDNKVVGTSGNVGLRSKGDISGFSIQQGASTAFVRNDAASICRGDIFVKGTLLLKNLNLETDANSCRVYVIGSVYIEGPITYKNPDQSSLQIVSSGPVFMGIKYIEPRAARSQFVDGYFTLAGAIAERDNIAAQITEDAGPYYIMYEGTNYQSPIAYSNLSERPIEIGRSGTPNVVGGGWQTTNSSVNLSGKNCLWVVDTASAYSAPYNCAVMRNNNYQRKSIDYKHLLIVAPELHDRYSGLYQGAVVSNWAMFGLGNLRFEFDPMLKTVPIFPALNNYKFLEIKQ